jgi:predicted DsbA family dithiol-disulfide isomerase
MSATPQKLTIDIVSDVVCPWCAIGHKGLEQALDALGDRADATIAWHPFELAPGTPPEGQGLADYTRERYGAAPEQSRRNRDRIIEAGAALGIDFRYSDESRIYNTFKAHQLLHWAGEQGRQTELKLALFKAYFTDQANVSEDAVLLYAVASAGLDREAAAAVLADQRYAGKVRAEENYWVEQNITGVPAFIINGKYMIPGAQDAETFGRVLEKVLEKEAA